MAISKRLRFEILRRDNHTCRYCGASAPAAPLRIDHVIPEALGGKTEPSNLVTACEPCNSGKSSTAPGAPLVADVRRDAVRWARAMKAASNSIMAERERLIKRCEWFDELWMRYGYGWDGSRDFVPRPDSWRDQLERFWAAGLTDELLADLVQIAMDAQHVEPENTWRYFCGCAWRRVELLHERAQEIVETLESSVYFARN